SPKANAEIPAGQAVPATTYSYYGDGDLDLSASVSAGGWLKGVTDPTGHFVAFAFDEGGNVARSWDRNATAGLALSAFPGGVGSPPSCAYTEVLHNPSTSYGACPPANLSPSPYIRPWRYLVSRRDQLAELTTYGLDSNGNPKSTTPPRGNVAGNTTDYTVRQTFDAADELLTR